MSMGCGHELANGGGVAQPEIEPLSADRRDDMAGLAYERDAMGAKCAGAFDREREHAAVGLDLDLAQDRMGASLDHSRKLGVGKRFEARGVLRIGNEDKARALAR